MDSDDICRKLVLRHLLGSTQPFLRKQQLPDVTTISKKEPGPPRQVEGIAES